MLVVVTDRKYAAREDPYGDVVERTGDELVYAECETYEEVLEGVGDADVIVTFKAPIDRAVLERADGLRGVVRVGTGYDTIDVQAANDLGVPVSNVPGRYCAEDLATHAIGLMIAAAHEIPFADREMRETNGFGERREINPVYGGTFGIVGLGHIGRAAVAKARGLDMDVIGYDPYLAEDLFDGQGVEQVTFDELLDRSDCVSLHTPLTAETHHLLSTEEFARMKETAVVVNTARGPIIDETALVEAVEGGEIFAAGLDVFETEPPTDSPALGCERIVCSPHHGGKCARNDERCIAIVRAEIERYLTDEHPRNVVNPAALQEGGDQLNPERHRWT